MATNPNKSAEIIARHRTQRLQALVERVRAEVPGAQATDVANTGDHLASTVTFANGYVVLLSLDVDFLDVFFEVVRFIDPGDMPPFSFERPYGPGSAGDHRLTGDAAVSFLKHYSQLPPRASGVPAQP